MSKARTGVFGQGRQRGLTILMAVVSVEDVAVRLDIKLRDKIRARLHLITPRPLALASPVPRVPRVVPPPRPILEVPDPLVLEDGAGTRDWRAPGVGVWNFGVGFEDVGGFSTNEVSVVLGTVSKNPELKWQS